MKEILPDIDKLFMDAEKQHQESPSDKVWDTIERNLDKRSVVNITRRYDRMKWVAAILLFLLGSVSAYLFLKPNTNNISVYKTGSEVYKAPDIEENPQKNSNNTQTNSPNTNTIDSNNSPKRQLKFPDSISSNSQLSMRSDSKNRIVDETSQKNGTNTITNNKYGSFQKVFKSQKISNLDNRMPTDLVATNRKRKNTTQNTNSLPNFNTGTTLGNVYGNNEKNSITSLNSSGFLTLQTNPPLQSINGSPEKDLKYSFSPQEAFINNQSLFLSSPNNGSSKLELVRSSNKNSSYKKYINKTSSKGLLELTAYYSPDFSFDHLKDDKPPRPNLDRQHVKDNEQHTFSFTSGITAGLKISKLITVQAGIAFSQNSIDNHPKTISAEKDSHGDIKYRFDASCGFGYFVPHSGPPPRIGDSLMGVSSHNTLQFLQIPVSLKFNKQLKNVNLTGITGLSINKLISGMINTTVNNPNIKESQTISSVEGLKRYSLTGIVGAGAELKINKKLSLSLLPTVRIALTSINSGSSVKSYPTSLGISTGLKLNL